MAFVLPSKADVGVLDPEISGEGERVIMSDGEQVSWTPPPAKPVMPDWSGIKSIARYFNRQGHSPWPAWVYHPSDEPRLLKNADEGAKIGVCYRQTTPDEKSRYGKNAVWDWQDGVMWRPDPWPDTLKFNPAKPGQGKTVVFPQQNPASVQNALIRDIIPQVAAAVAQALKMSGPAAPANIDPADWTEFQQFLAFKKSQEAVGVLEQEIAAGESRNALAEAGANGVTEEQEYSLWAEEAEAKGIKVDKRWSLARLKMEVEKAA